MDEQSKLENLQQEVWRLRRKFEETLPSSEPTDQRAGSYGPKDSGAMCSAQLNARKRLEEVRGNYILKADMLQALIDALPAQLPPLANDALIEIINETM